MKCWMLVTNKILILVDFLTVILANSTIFDNTPENIVRTKNFCTWKLAEEPNLFNVG